MGDREMKLSLHGPGPIDAKTAGEGMLAFDGLFRAVSKEVTGEEIGLVVTGMDFVCDGCGISRPDEHSDWIYDEATANDYCPKCQADREAAA